MENLLNKVRLQFAGVEENKAELGSTRDPRIPIQKTQSFKEEKKKGQSWFQKQFSRNRSCDYDSRETEHAAAVAAAAFAINLQEASEEKSETPEAQLTKAKSKVDNTKSTLRSASKRLSGSFRYKDDQGDKMTGSSVTEEKKPEKVITPAPSMKKTSTFTDKKPRTVPSTKVPPPPPPPPPPPIRKTSTKQGPLKKTSTGPSVGETKADEWERTELDKIRQRNEKLKETIGSWENKKKVKAKSKLNKQESEIERRRFIAMEKFQNEMKYINKVADGARGKADENRKTEEIKAREKATAIRTTGKLPRTCFCF